MKEEIWTPVRDWEGYYEISTLGNIRSLDREYEVTEKRWNTSYKVKTKGRVLSPGIGGSGYLKCVLTKGPKKEQRKNVLLHRLVAEAFIPNPENKPNVHHRDHDKTNNSVDNLEWVTQDENVQYALEAGVLTNEKRVNRKFSQKQIEWMRSLSNLGYTIYNLAEIFNTGIGIIREFCDITERPKRHRNKWCFSCATPSTSPQPFTKT